MRRAVFALLLLAVPAFGAVDRPFERVGETAKSKRYLKLADEPGRGIYRNSTGSWEAWVFDDGWVEHAIRWSGRHPQEVRFYDVAGDRFATVLLADDAYTKVTVHGRSDRDVDVAGWVEVPFPADGPRLVLRLPPAVALVADSPTEAHAELGPGALRVGLGAAGDVWSDAFRDGFAEGCGCRLIDRQTGFVAGKLAAHYMFVIDEAEPVQLGEAWAVPIAQGTLFMTYTTAAGSEPPGPDDPALRLAEGRAALVLSRWEGT